MTNSTKMKLPPAHLHAEQYLDNLLLELSGAGFGSILDMLRPEMTGDRFIVTTTADKHQKHGFTIDVGIPKGKLLMTLDGQLLVPNCSGGTSNLRPLENDEPLPDDIKFCMPFGWGNFLRPNIGSPPDSRIVAYARLSTLEYAVETMFDPGVMKALMYPTYEEAHEALKLLQNTTACGRLRSEKEEWKPQRKQAKKERDDNARKQQPQQTLHVDDARERQQRVDDEAAQEPLLDDESIPRDHLGISGVESIQPDHSTDEDDLQPRYPRHTVSTTMNQKEASLAEDRCPAGPKALPFLRQRMIAKSVDLSELLGLSEIAFSRNDTMPDCIAVRLQLGTYKSERDKAKHNADVFVYLQPVKKEGSNNIRKILFQAEPKVQGSGNAEPWPLSYENDIKTHDVRMLFPFSEISSENQLRGLIKYYFLLATERKLLGLNKHCIPIDACFVQALKLYFNEHKMKLGTMGKRCDAGVERGQRIKSLPNPPQEALPGNDEDMQEGDDYSDVRSMAEENIFDDAMLLEFEHQEQNAVKGSSSSIPAVSAEEPIVEAHETQDATGEPSFGYMCMFPDHHRVSRVESIQADRSKGTPILGDAGNGRTTGRHTMVPAERNEQIDLTALTSSSKDAELTDNSASWVLAGDEPETELGQNVQDREVSTSHLMLKKSEPPPHPASFISQQEVNDSTMSGTPVIPSIELGSLVPLRKQGPPLTASNGGGSDRSRTTTSRNPKITRMDPPVRTNPPQAHRLQRALSVDALPRSFEVLRSTIPKAQQSNVPRSTVPRSIGENNRARAVNVQTSGSGRHVPPQRPEGPKINDERLHQRTESNRDRVIKRRERAVAARFSRLTHEIVNTCCDMNRKIMANFNDLHSLTMQFLEDDVAAMIERSMDMDQE